MIEYFSKPKFPPKYLNYSSFLLCRPGKSYKINANVCIIKNNKPILFDVGLDWNMLFNLHKAIKLIGKNPKDVIFAVVSHTHPDHFLNLMSIRRFFPNIKIIIHRKTYESFMNVLKIEKNKIFRQKSSYNKIFDLYLRFLEKLEGFYVLQKNKVYIVNQDCYIPRINIKLKIIHTPGHSAGHICLQDCSNKILFLGDHLPFTPWLDISEDSIDDMIYSIKKLLKISSKEIKYSVRGHGNLSDNSREIYPWDVEKERFKSHLDLIEESIELIPKIIKNRAMTIEQIAFRVLKNKDFLEYSSLMTKFFIPPNLTWIICYLLKLEKEQKVKCEGNRWISI
ncbi:MAG: MBL fold metallo-hydrolase [Promethearchaeia archaeon]